MLLGPVVLLLELLERIFCLEIFQRTHRTQKEEEEVWSNLKFKWAVELELLHIIGFGVGI